MNIEEIRKRYPQYSDLDDKALVDGLHAKFYSDMPVEDFYSRVGYSAPEAKVRTFGGTLKDIGVALTKGAVGVGEMGLALGPKKLIQRSAPGVAELKEDLEGQFSPAQQEANRKVAEADGFLDTAGEMIKNPSTIGMAALESAPSMLAGGGVGRGLVKAGVGPLLGAAAGEGVVSGLQSASEIRQESGGDLSLKQAGMATASGIGTGIFGLIGGRIAKRLGFADIDTMLVGSGTRTNQAGIVKRIIGGGVSEGALEELPQSAQEQIWLNAATGKPILSGVPESMAQGLLVGGAIGGGVNVVAGKGSQAKSKSDPISDLITAYRAGDIDSTVMEAAAKRFPERASEINAAMGTELKSPEIKTVPPGTFDQKVNAAQAQAEADTSPTPISTAKKDQFEFSHQEQRLPQPKSAEESARVFQEQRQPAVESFEVFDRAGLTKPVDQQARGRNQRVIDRTNLEAEAEIDRNTKLREEIARARRKQAEARIPQASTADEAVAAFNEATRPDPASTEPSRLILPQRERPEVARERQAKTEGQSFARTSQEGRAVEAERKIKEAQRLGIKIDPQQEAELRAEIERARQPVQEGPDYSTMVEKGRWSEPAQQGQADQAAPNAPLPLDNVSQTTGNETQADLSLTDDPQGQATAKEPWEMTRDEFDTYWVDRARRGLIEQNDKKISDLTNRRVDLERSIGSDKNNPGNQQIQAEIDRINSEMQVLEEKKSAPILKPSEFMSDGQYRWHQGIDEAIKKGLPVPPEVLKDYPDLQVKQPPATSPKSTDKESLTVAVEEPSQTAESFNAEHPGNAIKYDGEQDRSPIGKPPLYQFTAYEGPAKGATFNVESPTVESVKAKLDEMVDLRARHDKKLEEVKSLRKQARDEGHGADDIREAEESGRRAGAAKAEAARSVQAEPETGEAGQKSEVAPKPKAIGRVWTGNQWRPIISSREITKGKNKGKLQVDLPNGRKKVVDQKSVKLTDQKTEPQSGIKKRLSDATGSTIIAKDLYNFAFDLVQKGVKSLTVFKARIYNRFRDVWKKIKPHLEDLWNSLKKPVANERGGTTLERSESPKKTPEQILDDFLTKRKPVKQELTKNAIDAIDKLSTSGKLKAFLSRTELTRGSKKDLSYFGDLIASIPSFFADKIPGVKIIFDASQDRMDNFHEGVHWMENHDAINTVRSFKELSRIDKAKYEAVQNYLIDTDATGYGFRIAKDKKGNWEVYDPKKNVVATFKAESSNGIDIAETKAIEEMVKAEARHLSKKGFTPKQIEAVVAFRHSTNKGFEVLFSNMRKLMAQAKEKGFELPTVETWKGDKKVKISLDEAMAMMSDIRGYYFPRIRKKGRFILTAVKGEDRILEPFTSGRMMNVRKAELKSQGYKVETGKNRQLGEDVFELAGNLVKTQQIVNAALEKTEKAMSGPWLEDESAQTEYIDNITSEINDIFRSVLSEQIGNVIRERGSRAHMIKRADKLWKGYETDPQTVIAKYIRGLSAGEAKRQMTIKMFQGLTGTSVDWKTFKAENEKAEFKDYIAHVREAMIDQREQPNAFKWALAYIGENTRNQETADRVLGVFKGIAVAKYLAFRFFSAPVVNLTALPTSTIASMKAAGIPYIKTWGNLSRGIKQYGQYRIGGNLSPEAKRVFEHIHSKGWDNPQFNSEALSTLRSAAGKGMDEVIKWGMVTFAESERMNRGATIAATYYGLKGKNPSMGFDELMEEAKKVSDDAHGIYNRGNYPYIALGKNPAAMLTKMFYVFRTFSHTYLMNMKKMGFKVGPIKYGKGDNVALMHMLIAPAVIGGMGSSVLAPVLAMILKGAGLDDPLEETYLKIGEMFGPRAEGFARFGAAGSLGFSIKGSLSIGTGDLPTELKVKDFLGAPGSVIEDIYRGAGSLARGDVSKGVEKLMPTGLGNMLRAYREHTEGLTTTSNAPLFYGPEQLKLTTVEAFYRGLSLNPVRIATAREKQWSERKVESQYREWAGDIYAKIKKLVMDENYDEEAWAEIYGEIESYNEGAQKWNISPITNKSIKRNLKTNFRPRRREREREGD